MPLSGSIRFVVALVLIGCASPPPPAVCGGATLDPIVLVAGGRARVSLSDALATEVVSISATGPITAVLGAATIDVRAGYEATETALDVTCTHGTISVPVSVEPLRFARLSEWERGDPTRPQAREYFAWWIDPRDDASLYLYGGFVYEPRQFTPASDAWRLDLTTLAWSRVTQSGSPPPPGGRVAPGPDGSVLYFGGASVGAGGEIDTPVVLSRFESDGDAASWSDAPELAAGLGSYTGGFVHDAARGRWLSVCGAESRRFGLHCMVHAYTPEGGFERLEVDGEPPSGRYGFAYALDAETDRVVVFAGQTGPTNDDLAGDTWTLELAPDGDATRPRWVRLFDESEGVSARRNCAYALDPEGHRFFVWGGTPDGATSVPGLDVLSLDRGSETWTHVDLPEDVPPRTSGAGVHDPARHRILWGFGNDDALYRDLFALELAPGGDA